MNKIRTTITLPREVLKEAKHRAVENDISLSELIARDLTLSGNSKNKNKKQAEDAYTLEDFIGRLNTGTTTKELKRAQKKYYEEMLH